MIRARPYSQRFIDSEIQKIRDSDVFVALADYAYIQDLFVGGHYVRRQINLAVEMGKPVLLAFEARTPEVIRRRVRSYFRRIDTEMSFDSRNVQDRQRIIREAEAILQKLYPDEDHPKAQPIDAFNDPMHGLERIGK